MVLSGCVFVVGCLLGDGLCIVLEGFRFVVFETREGRVVEGGGRKERI